MPVINDTKEIEEIIESFNPKIKKSLRNTSYKEKEDLEQAIKLKIVEKIKTIEIEEPPSFWMLIKSH